MTTEAGTAIGAPSISQSPRRWLGLAALSVSVLVVGFDATILNVALTTLSTELDASTSQLQWIIDAYLLVFAAMLLPAGLAGDRFGRARTLVAGLLIFGVASLVGAWSDTSTEVIAARALMGVGAAVILPATMSLIPTLFAREERTRAIGIWSAVFAAGIPLGPILGGWLLRHFWWGSVFVVNLPILIIAVIASVVFLPESRDESVPRIDFPGVILVVVGLSALAYGIIEAPTEGLAAANVIAALVAGIVLLGAFVVWQHRASSPMIDVALLRCRSFVVAIVVTTLASAVMYGVLFLVPQYLESGMGNDAFGTGVRIWPLAFGVLCAAAVTERLALRLGYAKVIAAGMAILATGCAIGAMTSVTDRYWYMAVWLAVVGLGLGLSLIPGLDVALKELSDDEAGRGSGLVMAFRQIGAALGVAVLGSVMSTQYRRHLVVEALPQDAADAAQRSFEGAAVVAQRMTALGLDGEHLLGSALHAYLRGMSHALVVCGFIAILGSLTSLIFLTRSSEADVDPVAPE
ncbi:MFS transporter [Nocardia rhizosphaerae]|uniref:MFS transporter n=1 Tax=Nocardia rhizosphaerae TaxID=1691571 RepID=A0ABV8L842_9NOCA